MNRMLCFFPVLILPVVAAAQNTSTTASNYAVFASNGTTTDFESEAAGTAVGRELRVRGRVEGGNGNGNGNGRCEEEPVAFARTTIEDERRSETRRRTTTITESGGVESGIATSDLTAGTSSDAPGTTTPTQGAHGLNIIYDVPEGTTGTVTIRWDARQSDGASVEASVDVDGDGTPEFTATGEEDEREEFPVTAGPNGIQIGVATSGSASLLGEGEESYRAELRITFRTSSSGGGLSVTLTATGPECLGALTADESTNNGRITLEFTVTGGAENGVGFLLMGDAAASPVALPFGTCQLLVDPEGAGILNFETDGDGEATETLRLPLQATTISFQAVTLGFAAGALGSTNALNLVVQ